MIKYTLLLVCVVLAVVANPTHADLFPIPSSFVDTSDDISKTSASEGDKGFFYNIFGVEWAPLRSLRNWWNKTEYSSSTPISTPKSSDSKKSHKSSTSPHTQPSNTPLDGPTDGSGESSFSRITFKSILDYVDDPARYETDVPQVCSLVDSFGWWIQTLGGILASSVLILKWRWEHPRRPPLIWFLDSVKNGSSQLAAHFLSVYIAEFASLSSPAHVSPCSWYLWVFIIDVTLGVALAFALLRVWGAALKGSPVGKSGHYGQIWDPESGRIIVPPDFSVFWRQLGVWILLCVIPSRIVCGSLVALFAERLLKPASVVSEIFAGHPRAELVFVLLVGPVIMNALQFLIQDSFLTAQPKAQPARAGGADQMFVLDHGDESDDARDTAITVSAAGFIGGEPVTKEMQTGTGTGTGARGKRGWGAAWDSADSVGMREMGLHGVSHSASHNTHGTSYSMRDGAQGRSGAVHVGMDEGVGMGGVGEQGRRGEQVEEVMLGMRIGRALG